MLLAQSYIDFEIAEGERARTAALYERLLNRTSHVKVLLPCMRWLCLHCMRAAGISAQCRPEHMPSQWQKHNFYCGVALLLPYTQSGLLAWTDSPDSRLGC